MIRYRDLANGFSKAIRLDNSQNLNYYFDVNTLYSWIGSSVPSNAPVADGGSMYCIPTNWGCIQVVSSISSGLPIHIRHCDKSSGNWKYGTWDQINNSDLISPIVYRGAITGDLDRIDIVPGHYVIGAGSTVQNAAGAAWCAFVQLSAYNVQMIIGDGVKSRKRAGDPPRWTQWT